MPDSSIQNLDAALCASFLYGNEWLPLELDAKEANLWQASHTHGIRVDLQLKEDNGYWSYVLSFEAPWPTRVRLGLKSEETDSTFHLIPANIHGDNNLEFSEPGHFPILTDQAHESEFSASLWEFRADRAPYPLSALCLADKVLAISVDPYSDSDEERSGYIANGLYSELPGTCGISLGYGNTPVQFINKEEFGPASCHRVRTAKCTGRIYQQAGDRRAIHSILRAEYELRKDRPTAKESVTTAAKGLCDAFVLTNYSSELGHYSNMTLNLEGHRYLRPWRPLIEIGWTGGGPLAYPLLKAEQLLDLEDNYFDNAQSGPAILDEISKHRREESGFIHDLTEPWIVGEPPGNHVNGWWTGYPLCRDVHGAYTNGSAVYYMLKSALALKATGQDVPSAWTETALATINTAIELQREDGNLGFSYALDEPRVTDWEGFAGCWLAAAAALAAEWTSESRYLDAAKRTLDYYHSFVRELNCWGTPMDTWKSVDEEGNLAFLKLARHLHEQTGEQAYLDAAVDSANYELLWRYGYRTRPPAPPLAGTNWNSCGGSITSVSNPHAHPMGLMVTGELMWLAQQTGDDYWRIRAEDGVYWIMQCMELYPEVTGYGHYGVLTERFCPSDGLLSERFDDGTPSSIWFTYNGWAAAAALEGILDYIEMTRE